MTRQHFARMKTQPIYKAAVAFILALQAEGVPLSAIVTSDWRSSVASVYIDKRGTRVPGRKAVRGQYFANHYGHSEKHLKRYQRLDRHGIRQAAAWWHKDTK